MDALAIRHLSRQLDTQSAEVETASARLDKMFEELPWTGRDRERFLDEWRGDLAPRMRRASALLREASLEAQRSAQDQERVSRS